MDNEVKIMSKKKLQNKLIKIQEDRLLPPKNDGRIPLNEATHEDLLSVINSVIDKVRGQANTNNAAHIDLDAKVQSLSRNIKRDEQRINSLTAKMKEQDKLIDDILKFILPKKETESDG
jgi:capsule polysaccharide export protein KpsE/RkpR